MPYLLSRKTRCLRRPPAQRGAAFIVMLVIMVLGMTLIVIGSLSSAGIKIQRDVKTAEALAQAKEALIGLSVIYSDYPGSLPCPDTDDDGASDAGGLTNCPQYVGRLPWKTLGLPDLRDAAGERLWYALSRNVRRYDSVRPLNSNTTGTLNVTGTTADNALIAIVFAPGNTVGSQSRSGNSTPCSTTGTVIKESLCAANYLEGSNADPSPGAAPNLAYQNANTGVPFNDQLITISHDHLFPKVEKRVGVEIKNILNTYRAAWGAYPFAAPFDDPSTSTYTGLASPATHEGLLPVGDNVIPTWADIPTVSLSGGGSVDYCDLDDNGAGVNNTRWRCQDISISSGETITITGTLKDVGRGLWRPHNINNICEVRAKNALDISVLATSELNEVKITNQLNADGSATIIFSAKGKAGHPFLKRIELRDIFDYTTDIRTYSNTDCNPKDSPIDTNYNPTNDSPIIPQWLFNDIGHGNAWQQVAYYAISDGHAPGSSACNPLPGTPSCLTVNGSGGGNDKQAVVAMTGAALGGQSRAGPNALCPATGTSIAPSACISNYLESANAIPADFIYENKFRSSTFNDQVIVVAP